MPLSAEQRSELLDRTREAASAFLEDVDHIREVVAKSHPSRGEIRRLSSILRRLLSDREIATIATPRLGRVTLVAPDNKPAYHADKQSPLLFYASGRADFLGAKLGIICAFDITPTVSAGRPFKPPELHNSDTIPLRLEGFLTQRVICYRGNWVSRDGVIKYVANVASGVHSGSPKSDDQLILARIRSSCSLSLRNGGVHVELFRHGLNVDKTTFRYEADSIDPVLIELLAAARFFSESPFVSELEGVIQKELS